jgi:hypothetical protein
MGGIPYGNGKVVIGSRHEAHCLYGKQLMYYTISRAFIDVIVHDTAIFV